MALHRVRLSVCDRCSDVINNLFAVAVLDEESSRSRNFQPSRLGWILSSLNQNLQPGGGMCAEIGGEGHALLALAGQERRTENGTESCVPSCYLLQGRFSESSVS